MNEFDPILADQRFADCIQLLNQQLQTHSRSRAALSLLGYCYYQLQDFVNAADCYEQLTIISPDIDE